MRGLGRQEEKEASALSVPAGSAPPPPAPWETLFFKPNSSGVNLPPPHPHPVPPGIPVTCWVWTPEQC